MGKQLVLARAQILAYRRHVQGLNGRAAMSEPFPRHVAWAGIQDSMPRAALLSIHARLSGTNSNVLTHPSLIQVWGPRYNAYVIAEADLAVFTLGRLPSDPRSRQRAFNTADEIGGYLEGRTEPLGVVAAALGGHPNRLRYAATTGTVAIHWDGARQPTIHAVSPPEIDPQQAQDELARRYLHILGPGTPNGFARWAGIKPKDATATFTRLEPSLTTVATPIGELSILAADAETTLAVFDAARGVRLLPSGDTFYLFWGSDRNLLVPEAAHRERLWTSRVWPGALLVDGELVGTWRRSKTRVTIEPWPSISSKERRRVEAEAETLPLPDHGPVTVAWV